MRTVRITAKTIDAAVSQGLEQLGISREEAVVHVVEQPSSGLFGMFHKKMAVVDISAPDEDVVVEEPSPASEAPKAEEPEEETLSVAETRVVKTLSLNQKNRNRLQKKPKHFWKGFSRGCIFL